MPKISANLAAAGGWLAWSATLLICDEFAVVPSDEYGDSYSNQKQPFCLFLATTAGIVTFLSLYFAPEEDVFEIGFASTAEEDPVLVGESQDVHEEF